MREASGGMVIERQGRALLWPFLLLAGCIYGIALLICLRLPALPQPQLLADAVSLDLTVTLTLGYWLLIARPQRLPWAAVAACFAGSLLFAELLLPGQYPGLLTPLAIIAAPLELLLIGFIVLTVRRYLRLLASRRKADAGSVDMLQILRDCTAEVTGRNRIAELLASELAMLHYACSRPALHDSSKTARDVFSYHERCSYGSLVLAVSILAGFELVAVHALVASLWSHGLAWLLSGLSAYGLLWLRADYVASTRRPLEIRDGSLLLRCGLRWTAVVPLELIESLDMLQEQGRQSAAGELRMLLCGDPNCRLRLREPVLVHGAFGIRRRVNSILLAIDDHKVFVKQLGAVIAADVHRC
ncbi:MAG: hypothetical protein R3F46_09440 [bacterium]